ncbi:hypothetical protein GQX74_011461 [Glossina fuscipes]|nr:hypothetical protein GQX74_011461 [Glossina fuscipes]
MFNHNNKVCAATVTPPATLWQGSHYTASIKEIEALRREFGLDIRMLEKHLVPRYKCSQPQASARNKLVNYSESKRFCSNNSNDSTLTVRTDWILRYSECKENFHPWSQGSFKKRFAQFDLVPWRKCRSKLDLTTQIDFNKSSMEIPNNILNRLQKLEHRQNRRQLKKTIVKASDVKSRRFVRVCLMFSIELRHRRMEFLKQTSLPRRIFKQKLYQSDCDIAEYERILTNAYSSIDDHLGYFGTRQLGQSASRTDSAKPLRTLQYFQTEYTSVEFQNNPSTDDLAVDVICPYYPVAAKSSLLSVEFLLRNQIVPCAKCRTKAIQLRTTSDNASQVDTGNFMRYYNNHKNKMHSHQTDSYDSSMHSGSISSIERPNGGALALHYAAARGCLDCVQLLVAASPDICISYQATKAQKQHLRLACEQECEKGSHKVLDISIRDEKRTPGRIAERTIKSDKYLRHITND